MIQNLIKLCIQKNRKAQRELFEKFADKLFMVCYRYLKSESEAEDILLTGFVKIFDNLNTLDFRNESGFLAWMKKIMVNECLMLLRKKKNFIFVADDNTEYRELAAMPMVDLETEDIYKLIINLPIGYRTVFNLFCIEGYNHKEIAEKLGITEATSKSQLFKAKKALQEQLVKQGINYGR